MSGRLPNNSPPHRSLQQGQPLIPPLARWPGGNSIPPPPPPHQSRTKRPTIKIPPPPPRSQGRTNPTQASRIQPIAFSPRAGPKSPGRMTEDEEEQMRIAIMESLQGISPLSQRSPIIQNFPVPTQWVQPNHHSQPSPHPAFISSPSTFSPPDVVPDQDDVENELLQAAIEASMAATTQTQAALSQLSQNLSPRSRRLAEDRSIREQQDLEYREAILMDQARIDQERLAAIEATTKAAQAAAAATRAVEAAAAQIATKDALVPPRLHYPIEATPSEDLYTIVFRLPSGHSINHVFDPREPFGSVLAQARYDTKHLGPIRFFIQGHRGHFGCSPETFLGQCAEIAPRTVFRLSLDPN